MPNKRHRESKAKSNVCLPFMYDSLNGTTSIHSMTYELLWQDRAPLRVTYWSRHNTVTLMIKRNLEINIKQGLILSLGETPTTCDFHYTYHDESTVLFYGEWTHHLQSTCCRRLISKSQGDAQNPPESDDKHYAHLCKCSSIIFMPYTDTNVTLSVIILPIILLVWTYHKELRAKYGISGFRRGALESFVLLGCYTA